MKKIVKKLIRNYLILYVIACAVMGFIVAAFRMPFFIFGIAVAFLTIIVIVFIIVGVYDSNEIDLIIEELDEE